MDTRLGYAAKGMAARALAFQILTAARPGEVRGATWGEIDREAGLWRIPAARTKQGRPHEVPLAPAALVLLDALPQGRPGDPLFPGLRNRPLSENACAKLLRELDAADREAGGPGLRDPDTGAVAVPHGLRATFRNWAAEVGADREIAELCLGHAAGSTVERAYRRTQVLGRRRVLMTRWADHVTGAAGAEKVVSIRR